MTRIIFPIHHTFGPLVTDAQWKLALRYQFLPRRWVRGPETEELRSALSHHFGMSVSLFASGREALLAGLRALDLHSGDEVIVQGFTCVAVPNAIHAAGGAAVYVDIDPDSLNLDMKKLQSKITPRTKAIICQHTFGIPADTEKLRAICDKRNITLIEDCAHIIPDGKLGTIGTRGDLMILSFGRDKCISGVAGGAVLTRHGTLGRTLDMYEKEAGNFSLWRIINLMNYPLRYRFAKWVWKFPLGANVAKAYLRWLKVMGLLPPVYEGGEKEGKMTINFHRMPNVCAAFALEQLRSLASLNGTRRQLSRIYGDVARAREWSMPNAALDAPVLQKFPVFARDAKSLRAALKREQIYLDDGWCNAVVNPPSVAQEGAGYAKGMCPVAEDVAKHIVTLPTHPTMTKIQAEYLILALSSRLV